VTAGGMLSIAFTGPDHSHRGDPRRGAPDEIHGLEREMHHWKT